jgi:outer membrane protein assembly factor BamB
MRDAARIKEIREAPGGVVDVSVPLSELWTWEGSSGPEDTTNWFAVADLGGDLTFLSEGELVGLDPASGDRAWSVPLGENPDCGPLGYPGMGGLATSSLVCLQGADAAREAVTVGPGGVTSEPRALDAADDRRHGTARPGPDGMVLRAQRIGPESAIDVGDARCTATTGECSGTVEAGRDLRLRAEDATTGEERWRVTVAFRATPAQECTPWYGNPWNRLYDVTDDEALAPDAFGAQAGAGLIDLWGCGTWAAVTPEGGLVRTDGVPGMARVVSLGDTRHAGQMTGIVAMHSDDQPRTVLFGPDGDVVGEIPGYVSAPQATDEPDALTLLASDESGYRLRSYTTDGTVRWDVEFTDASPQFLAQVAGTAVATTWNGSVRGFDVATGAERWTWVIGETEDPAAYGSEYAEQAFIDGEFVLLVVRRHDTGMTGLASLDATSGELVWEESMADTVGEGQNAALLAIDGHLLAVTPAGITGLG